MPIEPFDPQAAFPEFYNSTEIQALGQQCRWTVSDSDKMPINMRRLMLDGQLRGAHALTEECLLTLPELTQTLPTAANCAFYLRSQLDGIAVLDIEPSCPPVLAEDLLALPSLYTERSMSGNGYHVVLPLPSNFWDYPAATAKTRLQRPDRHYEILLEHWVTFTRHALPTSNYPKPSRSWDEVYAALAAKAVTSDSVELNVSSVRPQIPHAEMILTAMIARGRKKDPAKFNGDMSSYEFSVLATMRREMNMVLRGYATGYADGVYDSDAQAWLLYDAVLAVVPHRDKHDGTRKGMPLLFDRAVWVLSHHDEP